MSANWPDPPGWDPTPCCGSHAFLPFTLLAAHLYLAARRKRGAHRRGFWAQFWACDRR